MTATPGFLITRPRADAPGLVDALAARGATCVLAPMLEIRELPVPSDFDRNLAAVQAVLLTSANGARALAAATARRGLSVLAVGDTTGRTAREHGFRQVASAGGDVDDLARLARDRLDPAAGALLHVAGAAVAGDLAGLLGDGGYEVRRAVLYDALPADRLSPAAVDAMSAGKVQGAVFFSPRTTDTFVSLARAAGVTEACAGMTAYCLSPAVAEAAEELHWHAIRVAARPDQPALLELVDDDLNANDLNANDLNANNGTDGSGHG